MKLKWDKDGYKEMLNRVGLPQRNLTPGFQGELEVFMCRSGTQKCSNEIFFVFLAYDM